MEDLSNLKPNEYVFIVDGYSTGHFYPQKLAKRGIDSIHIQSAKIIPPVLKSSFYPEDYLESYIYDGNLAEIITKMEKLTIKCVIPGCETGVQLADALSEKMGLNILLILYH